MSVFISPFVVSATVYTLYAVLFVGAWLLIAVIGWLLWQASMYLADRFIKHSGLWLDFREFVAKKRGQS